MTPNFKTHPVKGSIGTRLLVRILLCGFFFAVAEICVNIYLDYKTEIRFVESQIRQVEESYLKSIAKSTWNLETEQIRLQLEGALSLNDIKYLEVKSEMGDTIAFSGSIPSDKKIVRVMPLNYEQFGKQTFIGELYVAASLGGAFERLGKQVGIIILVRFFIALFISVFFLFIFQRLVARHLTAMAVYTQDLDPENLGAPLVLDRKSDIAHKSDELGQVVTAINKMQKDIQTHIAEIKLKETEKIEALKLADENEKFAIVGQVAGKIAHDFNNILGVIMGNTELSLLECREPDTRKTLQLIYEQTERGKNLTKNLVAFARDQEPRQEFFNIRDKIDLVLSLMKKDLERIEVIRNDRHAVPDLLADPGMIEHTLVNLIQNAIHALSKTQNPRIILNTYADDTHLFIEISDNGCGIPEEYLPHIYDISFTLKGSKDVAGLYKKGIKGTGYGMSNVDKYVRSHKGTISVESKVGAGTRFTIRLPIISKELPAHEKKEIAKNNPTTRKRLLIVEDEEAISGVQYRVLTQKPLHHTVDIASAGLSALRLFENNSYDLISLDYILAGDMNGMDVYTRIRQTNDTVPILFVSGNIEFLESLKTLKRRDPYLHHLSKPCQNKDYVAFVDRLLKMDPS